MPELRQRIVISLEGFANSFDVLNKAMNGLIEAGAIGKTNQDDNVVPVRPAYPNGDGGRPNG